MKVTVARTSAEIDAIAARWDEIPTASPHASRALFTLVEQTADGDVQPHVMLIEADDRKPLLVVARVERRPMRIKLGYRTLLSAPASWLVVVAGGIVGARSRADYDLVMRSLRAALRRGGADILQLSKVEVESPLHRAAREDLRWYRRGHGLAPQQHHRSDLSNGYEAFYATRSKRTRLRLRRRLAKLAEASGSGTTAVHRIGPDDRVEETVRLLDNIAAKSYQRGIGVGFVDDALHRGLVSWAVAGGPFRIWILSLDDIPVAFVNGLVHDRTFFLFHTAFDPSATDEEPGALLLAQVVKDLAEEPDIDTFDYGYGDALYKQQLSDSCWEEVDILGFAVRPRALSLNSLNTGAAVAVSIAKRVLGGDRVAALRRRRRAELAHAAPSGDADG
jgi:CelD/BcsL family acetyltransferase involved in cellulose biosynthesis